jgi:hypothetical protein
VRSQHLDGANRQPRGAVLGVRFQDDARHLGSARAPVEDKDVDRRGIDLGADLDDRIGVARGRDRFQPDTPVRHAQCRTGSGLGERDVEPERQQLPVEPRDRFGQLGRSASRPDDDDRGRLGARGPEQHDKQDERDPGRAPHATARAAAPAPIRHSCRRGSDEDIRSRWAGPPIGVSLVGEDHLPSQRLRRVGAGGRLGEVFVVPGNRLRRALRAQLFHRPEQEGSRRASAGRGEKRRRCASSAARASSVRRR